MRFHMDANRTLSQGGKFSANGLRCVVWKRADYSNRLPFSVSVEIYILTLLCVLRTLIAASNVYILRRQLFLYTERFDGYFYTAKRSSSS